MISSTRSIILGPPIRLAAAVVLGVAAVAGCSSNASNVAANIVVVSGNTQIGTVAHALNAAFVVKVTDDHGDPVQGANVTFTATGEAMLLTDIATTDASGIARDSVIVLGTIAGSGTVTASVNGVVTNAVFNFTVHAGAAAAIAIVSGNNQSAARGAILTDPLVVSVTDQYGNIVSSTNVTWTISAGIFLGNSQTVTDASGHATADVQLPGVAGVITVTATLQGTATTATFTETGT